MAQSEQTIHVDGSIAAAVSNGVVGIVREYTGRGPTKARTTITDELVVVVMGETLLKAERSLVASGEEDMVLITRRKFQATMREELTALVEAAVGRHVIAFMSDNHLEPDLAVELFVLGAPIDD
jgi:uncharacterized protein YbcI